MKPSQKEGRGFYHSHRPRVEEEKRRLQNGGDQGGGEHPTEPVLADGRESISPARRSLLAKLMMWRAPLPASGLRSGPLCGPEERSAKTRASFGEGGEGGKK